MPNAQMNFRIDAELKRRGDERFARLGCTPSDAMRRLYECASRYDDASEALLQSLIMPEGAPARDAGDERAQAVLDFQASLLDARKALGVAPEMTFAPLTDEELEEYLYAAHREKAAERGLA